jgi:hypothetical protein
LFLPILPELEFVQLRQHCNPMMPMYKDGTQAQHVAKSFSKTYWKLLEKLQNFAANYCRTWAKKPEYIDEKVNICIDTA